MFAVGNPAFSLDNGIAINMCVSTTAAVALSNPKAAHSGGPIHPAVHASPMRVSNFSKFMPQHCELGSPGEQRPAVKPQRRLTVVQYVAQGPGGSMGGESLCSSSAGTSGCTPEATCARGLRE